MIKYITAYLLVGTCWGLFFNILLFKTFKKGIRRHFEVKPSDHFMYIFLWPIFIIIFIWGMFFRK